ncbi:MAG: hypothetical protein L0229_31195 [Blastocatellia bacterium]|nr:hypothetical protein [Blastocatellia bacterium]
MQLMEKDEKLKRYLMGELSPQARIEIEDLYLADQDFYERLLIVEDDLIDDYVRGTLSARDRNLFEENFLCSGERRERVEIARTLIAYSDANASSRPASLPERKSFLERSRSSFSFQGRAKRLAVAVAIAALSLAGGWGWMAFIRLQSGFDDLQSEHLARQSREEAVRRDLEDQKRLRDQLSALLNRERNERGRVEQELEKVRERDSRPVIFSLGKGLVERSRGAAPEGRMIAIPRGRERLKFRLDLSAELYETYRIIVKDASEHTLWQGLVKSEKTSRGPAVSVILPSSLFAGGEYNLVLSGSHDRKEFEVIGDFPIVVVRK